LRHKSAVILAALIIIYALLGTETANSELQYHSDSVYISDIVCCIHYVK